MRRVFVGLVSLLLVGASAVASGSAANAADGLAAAVTPDRGKPGTAVTLTGQNWTPGASLQAVTCGALGIGGSASCDLAATYTLLADSNGRFSAAIKLGKPPKPCPCVVHVSAATSADAVDVPVTVVGQAKAPVPAPSGTSALPRVTVVSANVGGWGPWTSLFGAAPTRDLTLILRNTADVPVDRATVRLSTGSAALSDGSLLTTTVGPLAPHEVKTFTVPVTLGAGIGGTHTLTGSVDDSSPFTVETTSWAWGFFVLDLLLLLLFVWVVVRRVRRREQPTPGRHSQLRVEQTV